MAKLSHLKSYLPSFPKSLSQIKLNFYRLHLLYFIITILLSSIIVYGSTTNGNSGNEEKQFYLRYIDALFLCTTAMTNSGLNVVNLASITGFQQAVLFILIPLGNVCTVSTVTVYIRQYWFRKKMRHFIEHSKAGQAIVDDIERQETSSSHQTNSPSRDNVSLNTDRIPLNALPGQDNLRQRRKKQSEHHLSAHGGFPFPWQSETLRNAFHKPFQGFSRQPHHEPHNYLSFQPSLDHKGRFHSLDENQRTEIGGVEYRALKLLSWLLPAYFISCFCLGIVILVPYSYHHSVASIIRTSQPGSLEPGWWATFVIMSGFGNCGLNLLDENMIPFQGYYLVLIVAGAMILLGNQLFPVFLRFIIWTMFKLVPKKSEIHHTCAFLLHHPRRCFILLFPSINTWYLLAAQLSIDFVLWAFFGILNIGLSAVDSISAGNQTIMGLFQALGVRVGGFYVILISNIAPALQIMYLVAMYISGFPILISLRQTNIYEERSLGLDAEESGEKKEGQKNYISTHIKNQLSYDLWWLATAIFLISIIERGQIVNSDPSWSFFTIWAVTFEVFSAYGTVGLSMGVPFDNYSFSGVWHTLSKLILILVMIRGRHRALPYAIDRAVLLPGEELMEKMDHEVNMQGSRKWKEQEKRVRRDEEGGQAEGRGAKDQDPEEDEETKRKFAGSTEEGPS